MGKLAFLGKVLAAGAIMGAPQSLATAMAQDMPETRKTGGQPDTGVAITLPSGAVVYWQETLHDTSGGFGLT